MTGPSLRLAARLLLVVVLVPATSSAASFTPAEVSRILRLSPLPPPPPDLSNRFADDPAAARLGQMLFFDPRLSRNGTTACATCHDPARGWSNGQTVTDPEIRFARHVPSLWNVAAYGRWFFWDGRADSAWSQALWPLESEREMATTRLRLAHHVHADRRLRRAYEAVFGPLPRTLHDRKRWPADAKPVVADPSHPYHRAWASMADADRETVDRIFSNLGKAIAAYERRIVSRNAPFDRFVAALRAGDAAGEALLSESAQRGLQLFVGRGQCTLCHSGPNLSDGEFHDVGIALGPQQRIDSGRYAGARILLGDNFSRRGPYADGGAATAPITFLVVQTDQLAAFKTPTLRDVAGSAPYMHDGRFPTLESVVRFYSTRNGASPVDHSTTLLKPLGLGDQDVRDLVSFLESLSGEPLAAALTRALEF